LLPQYALHPHQHPQNLQKLKQLKSLKLLLQNKHHKLLSSRLLFKAAELLKLIQGQLENLKAVAVNHPSLQQKVLERRLTSRMLPTLSSPKLTSGLAFR
jgi:hypothetical protein